jgi:hypothetical protein
MNYHNTNFNKSPFTKSLLASLVLVSILASSASADDNNAKKETKKTDVTVSAKRETTKSGDGKSTTTSGSVSVERKVGDNAKVHGKASHSETNHSSGGTETNSSIEVGGSYSF